MKSSTYRLMVAALGCLSLSGCLIEANNSDLDEYVNQVESRGEASVAPLPDLKAYSSLDYTALSGRNPFAGAIVESERALKLSTVDTGDIPNFDREREPLEAFSVDILEVSGALNWADGDGVTLVALVSAPDAQVYKVRVGNYIGKHHGQISEITNESITIEESRRDDVTGVWSKEERILDIVETE